MGSSASLAAAPPPPVAPPPALPAGLAQVLPQKAEEKGNGKGAPEKVDWLDLPCPVPYEELQREALSEFILDILHVVTSLSRSALCISIQAHQSFS